MKYETVIGIEVHVELNTKTKMFCRCSADYFGKKPNTHTCPVCLGLPGALPYTNEEAIKKCIQIGLALGCTISPKSLFERKNYFYPDLPKGYQISQYRWPLCVGGRLKLENGKLIRINRAHQEEDTGKLTHQGSETLIDFNRSGVPLVEVVTEPDFRTSEEVREYAKKLQQIFRTLGVSNADMERGDMRLEANVSVRPVAQKELPPYRVELKNINSFRFMVAAIEYEIKRQTGALEKGEKLTLETRGWDEDKKETYLQRSKEEAHDYRYFPEPDLPELPISQERVKEIKSGVDILMQSHPEAQKDSLVKYGMSPASAETIAYTPIKVATYQGSIAAGTVPENKYGLYGDYIANQNMGTTDMNQVPNLVEKFSNNFNVRYVGIISDDTELEKLIKQAIEENPKAVKDYKSGKENALQVLVGAVMRLSKGKADANLVLEILKKKLNN